MSQYVIKNITIQRVDDKVFNQENPRRIIGQDQAFVQKLVKLLIQANDIEVVSGAIIQLLQSLPINSALKNDLAGKIGQIKQSKSGDNVQAWAQLFDWDHSGPKSSKLPPQAFHSITLLYDMVRESPTRGTSTKSAEQEQVERN